jgi:hypothetical protein
MTQTAVLLDLFDIKVVMTVGIRLPLPYFNKATYIGNIKIYLVYMNWDVL